MCCRGLSAECGPISEIDVHLQSIQLESIQMTSLLGSDVVKPLALPPVLHDLFTGPELKGIYICSGDTDMTNAACPFLISLIQLPNETDNHRDEKGENCIMFSTGIQNKVEPKGAYSYLFCTKWFLP